MSACNKSTLEGTASNHLPPWLRFHSSAPLLGSFIFVLSHLMEQGRARKRQKPGGSWGVKQLRGADQQSRQR